jgi:hypothetical protein
MLHMRFSVLISLLCAAAVTCRWVVHWDVPTSLEGFYQVRL